MLTNLNIHRRKILYLFLVGYVVGAFQSPVFEAVHFLCHLVNDNEMEFKVHSYAAHDELHQHQTLDLICDGESEPQNQPLPTVDFDSKKKVEILKTEIKTAFSQQNILKNYFVYLPPSAQDFSEVPHAPPRFL